MSAGGTDVRERQEQVLTAFVRRARRVRAHSLGLNISALKNMQQPQYRITRQTNSRFVTLRMEYPPEEQVESAAARIRPLLLDKEDTHYAKTMKALLYFANEAEAPAETVDRLRALRKRWIKTASEKTGGLIYEVRLKQGDAPEESITDRQLAFAWVYGDVVHADTDRRGDAQVFGVEERFHAAVPLVAQLMVLTIETLQIIEWLHGIKYLAFLHDAFADDVVVTRQVVEQDVEAWVAKSEDGSLPPITAPGEELGEGWKRFGDEFGPSTTATAEADD